MTIEVLLVEDDVVDRKALERFVREQNLEYNVHTATTRDEAVEQLNARQFDVVLLDYKLGHQCGLEVLNEAGNIPVVFLTGVSDIRVAVDAMKRGAYDYLIKDSERLYLDALESTVDKVLNRKRTEVALVVAEERLQEIVSSQLDILFEIDREGMFVFLSASCEDVLGKTPREMQGMALQEFIAISAKVRVMTAIEEALGAKKDVRFLEAPWKHSDGSERVVSLSGRAFADSQGEVRGMRGSIRDVTELRNAQAALEKSNQLIAETRSELAQVKVESNRLRGHLRKRADFEGIVGRHPLMLETYEKIRLAAGTDVATHIQGASGTGKELVAQALHQLSPRAHQPFVVVNCSAIPETLLEATLFGHVKGAYTGATTETPGYLGRAEGGTLFLDEIGDLSPMIQVKLLRFLQEKEYERVGDTRVRSVDARIVTATHQDLQDLVKSGRMREDFFYRICVFPICLPTLAQRKSDIPLLVEHFIEKLRERTGRTITSVAPEVMSSFMEYSWPGNIRELENTLEYAFVVSQGDVIREVNATMRNRSHSLDSRPHGDPSDQKRVLVQALEAHDWNRTRAAESMGISRVTLWKRMKACGLSNQKSSHANRDQ